MKKYLIAMIVICMGTMAFGAEPNYQRFSVGYSTIDVDNTSENLTGINLGATFRYSDPVLLSVEHSRFSEGSLKVNATVLGGSYLHGLSNTTDLIAGVYLAQTSVELGSLSGSESNLGINAGIASRLSDLLQLEGGISFIDGNSSIGVGARFFIDPKASIDINFSSIDNSSTTTIGGSYLF